MIPHMWRKVVEQMIIWRERLYNIISFRPVGSLEILIALSALMRGLIWYFTTAPMWTKSMRPVWIILADIFPDSVWGSIFITLGVLQIFGVLQNHLGIRKLCAILSFITWTFASFIFFMGEPLLPNDGMLPLMALSSLFVFWTLPLEPREG
jgi:hypothetical protein